MHNLLALWQQRTRRERRLLLGMAVVLLIGLVYYTLWQPWQNREAQWRQTLARERPACSGCASRRPFSVSFAIRSRPPRRKNPRR